MIIPVSSWPIMVPGGEKEEREKRREGEGGKKGKEVREGRGEVERLGGWSKPHEKEEEEG
jgi:hypothetical protein